jgi:hypothetical protein
MSYFNKNLISQKRYIVSDITPSVSSQPIIPISPSRPRVTPTIPASQVTRLQTTFGINNNALDATADLADPNIDLGVLYSNGARLLYLDFRASAGLCDVTFPDTVIPFVDPIDGTTYDEFYPGYTITSAYSGTNAVVPMARPDNTPTNTLRPPSKVPFVPSKINC